MRDVIRLGGRLLVVALVCGLALGATYFLTKEPIERQQALAKEAARSAMSAGETTAVEAAELTGNIRAAYRADDRTILEVATVGYGGEFLVTVGVLEGGAIAGVSIGENNETPGLGKKVELPEFTDQFIGKEGTIELVKSDAAGNQIDAVASATISSQAVVDAVNEARAFALGEGDAQ
ncbi:MAG: FMN-binding protein [Clostridiales bacterium]|nr:FMN-binding protein [Clostridiales bacterium]